MGGVKSSGGGRAAVISALNTAEPVVRTPDSPYYHLRNIETRLHSESRVYPTLANGVTITAGVAAWTLGAFATIIPGGAITETFDIHYISIEDLSAVAVYELVLYYGATDEEAGKVRMTKNAVMDGTQNVPFQTVIIPASSQVRAKLASSTAVADTVDISVFYHTY